MGFFQGGEGVGMRRSRISKWGEGKKKTDRMCIIFVLFYTPLLLGIYIIFEIHGPPPSLHALRRGVRTVLYFIEYSSAIFLKTIG